MVLENVICKIVADRYDGASVSRFTNPLFLLMYFILIVRGLTWIAALKTIPLSKAYPVLSLSFPAVLAISVLMFNEALTWQKVIGSLLIISGLVITGKYR
jgi:drug/metabolite transporter (DMT)-like permease